MRFSLASLQSLQSLLSVLSVLSISSAAPATAQRTIAHDTLSGESPVAVTCGFCAGERLGVIFRELPPPARGLDPSDFPIGLVALQVAVASADAIGSGAAFSCSGSTVVGQASVGVAVYAGTMLPSDIAALSADDVWPGETLVWSAPDVPIERSVADAAGSASYEVNFNRLLLEDDAGRPFAVEAPNVYIRVVVAWNADTALSSALCDSLMLETPSAFGVRDNDAVVANERNFIFAEGLGWVWNEDVPGGGISGDWAVRLEIIANGGGGVEDAGMVMPDTGPADTGAMPGDAAADSAPPDAPTGGGCGCRTATGNTGSGPAIAALLCLFWVIRRRRTRPAGRRTPTGAL